MPTLPPDPRFPANGIISLLDVHRRFNLAESTARDLNARELLDAVGHAELDDLPLGYGSSRGDPRLRAAIAQGCGVTPEQVLTTTGTALALTLLAAELNRAGREIVLVTPCFPPTRDALRLGDGRVVELRTSFDDGYRIDPDRLAAALHERTALVMLTSPQNPSGVTLPETELDQVLDRVETLAPDAYVLVDETYREASYDDAIPPSAAARHPRVLTAASVSKAHGAPGLRVGWITTHDAALLERLTTGKMNTVISGSPLNERLAAALLERRELFLQPRRAMLARAVAIVERWVDEQAARIEWIRPDGGALCCVRLRPDVFTEPAVERFWKVLSKHDVQLADGSWFGGASGEFRLGFGYMPIDMLGPALDAVAAALSDALA